MLVSVPRIWSALVRTEKYSPDVAQSFSTWDSPSPPVSTWIV